MRISVLGINFRTASMGQREQTALNEQQAFELLDRVRREDIFEEALVLSTCNRTEVYYVSHPGRDGADHLLEHLSRIRPGAPVRDTSLFYCLQGQAAVEHLFRVAASLDSQIVGEHEILGQLKEAYSVALQARTASFLMHKLMHRAFGVGKRVQTETNLGQGTSSVPQAAAKLARGVYPSLAGKTVMLVGAGKAAELAAQALLREGATNLIVANRTITRAEELAGSLLRPRAGKNAASKFDCSQCPHYEKLTCPAVRGDAEACSLRLQPPSPPDITTRAIGMSEIPAVIGEVDLLISSTDSTEPVLTDATIGQALRRSERRILIIDIAVPRDVDPALAVLPNVRLFNLDHLDRQVADNLRRRQAEIPRAESIVADEARQFEQWLDSLAVIPTLKLLQEHVRKLMDSEIDRQSGKFTTADRENLARFARGLSRKILHHPLSFLTKLSTTQPTSADLAAVDLVRRMFHLSEAELGGPATKIENHEVGKPSEIS